jgi:archaellum component FlaC
MNFRPFVLLLVLSLAACTEAPEQSPQYQQLEADAERLGAEVAQRDSTINAMFGAFNQISENLRTIRAKQGQLTNSADGGEQGQEVTERIMSDLQSIDQLLAENRALLDKMRKQAKASAASIAELERTVAELERTVAEKDEEIALVKEQLASTNSSLATLIEMYRDKSQLADMQRNELNSAWYAVGTAKELRDNGVLTKEGGFIGLGKVDKLNTGAFPKDYFKQIDVMRSQEIPLLGKKPKLVTSHPAGSYRIEGDGARLVITDATAFWSITKYLVVVVE